MTMQITQQSLNVEFMAMYWDKTLLLFNVGKQITDMQKNKQTNKIQLKGVRVPSHSQSCALKQPYSELYCAEGNTCTRAFKRASKCF